MNCNGEELNGFCKPIISIGKEEVVLDNINSKVSLKGKKSHGFHLVRSKWDPYPWIQSVDSESSAEISGLRSGDCLLEIDGRDVLGLKMRDIAYLIGRNDRVSLSVWRRPTKSCTEVNADVTACQEEKDNRESCDDDASTLLEGPLPEVAQKLVRAVTGVVKALECPVCLESAAPPVSQCVHGHLLCFGCRLKAARCPVCRVRLGQGRCLLADKSHRALLEALIDQPIDDEGGNPVTRSLRDSIFGPTPKDLRSPHRHRPVKQLLSKVLSARHRSGVEERNASTESLPTSMVATQYCPMDGNLLYGRRWLLRLYDRRKSASTGELSQPTRDEEDRERSGRFAELRRENDVAASSDNSGSLLSVPQTPTWGGSSESISMTKLCCPLRERSGCRETVYHSNLFDHLNEQHGGGPMIHFYKNSVNVPVPFPFQKEAVYVLHQKDEFFILQNEKNKLWVSNPRSSCEINWEWVFHGVSKDNTEVHCRKEVVSLREPFELSSQHVVFLAENFSAPSVNISLVELNREEGHIKV